MKKHFFVGLSLVFSVFLLCAVDSSSEAASLKSSITGKWIRLEGHVLGKQIEFLKDGTFIDGETAGDYRFIDGNRLRMDARLVAMVFEVSIDKDGVLILKRQDGGVGRYTTERAYPALKAKLDAQIKAREERMRKAEEEKRKAEVEAKRKAEEEREEKLKTRLKFYDLTALDQQTTLMWTRDANIAGKQMNWDDAIQFITQLNEQKYAGHNDWRLPSKEELETLRDYARSRGAKGGDNNANLLNEVGFKNMQTGGYWSSSVESIYDKEHISKVYMSGMVTGVDKTARKFMLAVSYVLAVRGG